MKDQLLDFIKKNKVLLIIIGIVLFLILFFCLFLNKQQEVPKYQEFKDYNYYNISSNYSNLKYLRSNLIDDPYFIKMSLLKSSSSINDKLLGMINTIDEKQLNENPTSEMFKLKNGFARYYLSKENFLLAFNELYKENIDETNINNEFLKVKNNKVYITLDKNKTLDNNYLIGIKSISVMNKVITANIIVYSIISSELSVEKDAISYIKDGRFNEVNNKYVKNNKIKVLNKNIVFKELPDGYYFKYQLLKNN